MRDLPGPGLEPVPPALAGGFSTTAPPGKSLKFLTYNEPGILKTGWRHHSTRFEQVSSSTNGSQWIEPHSLLFQILLLIWWCGGDITLFPLPRHTGKIHSLQLGWMTWLKWKALTKYWLTEPIKISFFFSLEIAQQEHRMKIKINRGRIHLGLTAFE